MATERILTVTDDSPPFTNPWPALWTGVGGVIVGCLLIGFETPFWTVSGVVLLLAGLVATGVAIAIAPRSIPVLASAAFLALIGAITTHPRWDTVGLMLGVLAAVAAAAAFLVWLPQTARRVVVSAFILFHFVGILTAVTGVTPSPWLTTQLWSRVYRPYLQFLYLNNAYHFYSPEPGPAQQLWFRVTYKKEGDSKEHGHWFRIPNRDAAPWWDPLYHSYQRRLSLTESVNQTMPANLDPSAFHSEIMNRRTNALAKVPYHPNVALMAQYREPQLASKKMLGAYARHVWLHMEEEHPDWIITGVRVYRVQHEILQAAEYAKEPMHPESAVTFLPYYQGEYDREGRLKDGADPLLFWLIPIVEVPREQPPVPPPQLSVFRSPFDSQATPEPESQQHKIVNYLKLQAGDEGAGDALPPYDGEWK